MRHAGPLAILIATALLGGCGNDPLPVPDTGTTAAPSGLKPFVQPSKDVTLSYPANWALVTRRPPGVVTVASGGAEATVWAYRATSPVLDAVGARAALDRLLASLKRRDPGFKVTKTGTLRVAGAPAVQIVGTTRLGGRKVMVRSVHVYRGAGEYVLDAIADPAVFDRADRQVFQPMLDGLRPGGEPAATPAPGAAAPTVPPAEGG